MNHFTGINPRFQYKMRFLKMVRTTGIMWNVNKMLAVNEALPWMSYGKAVGSLGNFETTCHCGKQNTFLRSFRSFLLSSASIQSFGQISHIVWGLPLYKILENFELWYSFNRNVLPFIWNFISNVYIRIPNRVKFDKTNTFAIQSVIAPTLYVFQIIRKANNKAI